ncbi:MULTISPECIES: adenosylcobinamide-GDP ribazoletransferase [unclassified Pseudomonas]|uniref:adenosylcobinamide-GDP ribazoletransferase n=1 Tax=unclassified Pseudomonas TaxID=196821 RepID=UPI000BD90E0D|nr:MULTISPECIES: adenosylcobinamide-GDP ribazoletransferase [unclassified Pseudomonas]PVZ13941.1 cobalamin-5'-phosphate synthase [Pseudomonas sp. URIL14HWK12:I12]PVZ24247.1 cobalamin-5'-phosphate synthase [Pseudomonas sp. URIL14HWK12:I10]PVZ33114.1 cobalamin-5'-phosphate synthase [Pseudomonas sp. URIL14HWK12:I11]SNZ10446.1 cobalamin-5'-phosphate synthase [Pseudomonas sp. URIL14HWK12:I9]
MLSGLIALQFLSSLPVRLPGMPSPRALGRSLLWYPLVGCVFTVLLAVASRLLADAPPLLQAALVLCAWVALSGGLHLDGLADSADAWIGGYGDRERTLAIMKDPRSGPMAVVVLVLLLLIKFSALLALLGQAIAWWWVPVLGRTALLGLFLTTPYVRAGGLGQALAEHLPREAGWAVLLGVVLLSLWLLPLAVMLAALLAFIALRWLMIRRLGGCTGDTAGAMLELLECVVLVAAAL